MASRSTTAAPPAANALNTVESQFDAQAGGTFDGERPPLTPSQWRRPYSVGPCRVGGATLLLALCPMLLLGALVSYVADGTVRALVAGVLAVLLVALAVRTLRMGVWVSSRGLRYVTWFRTRTLSWSRIAGIRTRQEPVRVLGTPRRSNGQAVLVEMTDGSVLEEVLSDHDADFLRRAEEFEETTAALLEWSRETPARAR